MIFVYFNVIYSLEPWDTQQNTTGNLESACSSFAAIPLFRNRFGNKTLKLYPRTFEHNPAFVLFHREPNLIISTRRLVYHSRILRPGGAPALPWATAAAAVGPGGGGGEPQKNIQSPNRQYKTPTDFTKPRQTIQSHKKTIQSSAKL